MIFNYVTHLQYFKKGRGEERRREEKRREEEKRRKQARTQHNTIQYNRREMRGEILEKDGV